MGLENSERSSPAGVEPTTARVWPKLVSCKSLSECCEARLAGGRAGAEPGLVVGWCLGLENLRVTSPARVEPTSARILPKLFPSKSLAKAPNEKKYLYVRRFWD